MRGVPWPVRSGGRRRVAAGITGRAGTDRVRHRQGTEQATGRVRRWTVAATVVVVAGAGLGVWLATRSSGAAATGLTTTTSVQTVGTGTITQTVAATGTVEPASQADLDFAVAGRVTAVAVVPGQAVTAGATLATLDATALDAALAQAQATLADDQAQLASDQSGGATAAQIALDDANIASAQTQVDSAQGAVADATLTATISGTVASVDLAVGQQVTGSGPTPNGTTANGTTAAGTGASGGGATASSSGSTAAQVVLVSTGSYVVDTAVSSSGISQVQVGDQADVNVSGSTSTAPVYGTVGSVGLLATTTSGVSSFPVVVDVTGSPTGLYGGTSADVTIIVRLLQDAVVVPTAAISYAGGAPAVTLDRAGQRVAQPVTVGPASGGKTQVTSGLSAGQQIYVTTVSFRGPLGGARNGGPGGGGFGGCLGGRGGGAFGGGGLAGGGPGG